MVLGELILKEVGMMVTDLMRTTLDPWTRSSFAPFLCKPGEQGIINGLGVLQTGECRERRFF
jgi:hypothetical protein